MIIILMGVSGSGKSVIGIELSKELDWPFYDADDFHTEASKKKMHAGIPLNDEDRLPWLNALADLIQKHTELKEHMILACSALKESYRFTLNVHPSCKFVYLKGSFELIKKRMENRKGHFFNPELLQSQFETLEKPTDCLVVDIDDTVEGIVKTIREKLKV
jgi:gluconokinase